MRVERGRDSDNVEDRRGSRPRQLALGGGAGVLILALIALFLGKDPLQLLKDLGQGGAPLPGERADAPFQETPESAHLVGFVRKILASTEDVWNEEFRRMGRTYEMPKLVLFSGAVESACGFAQSASGPFYCPGDRKVYIDLSFYQDLATRHNAPGDAAQAYVIAHEIGHHVQNLLGISARVDAGRGTADENDLSVRLELQADFLAGLWVHHANKTSAILEPGDVEEVLNAAAAIGDDRLQKESRGYVVPDSFTHGTSAQRAHWFRKGLETGDFRQGDTFSAREL